MSFHPPIPSDGQSPPPPPGRAQRLVARSGFVSYEGGRSVFDESLTVYLSRSGLWPDADITDQFGRHLGAVRSKASRPFRSFSSVAIFDPSGARALHVKPRLFSFKNSFEVTGVSNGHYGGSALLGRELQVTVNNVRYGSIIGSSFRGLMSSSLVILDHNRNQVGEIRVFGTSGSPIFHRDDFVMSIDPRVSDEFRRLLVAAPVIATLTKRRQRNRN